MSPVHTWNLLATHRDYGPLAGPGIETSHRKASQRFNFAYPRGELLLISR